MIVTNLFVIALCGAMFYYIFKLQGSIQNQRVNINVQNDALNLTNRFTQLVHEAQSEANLFAFTDNPKHLKRFGELNNEISACADSILMILPTEKNKQRILEVERLILRKGQISYVLSRQFYYYDPLAEIDAKLKAFTPKLNTYIEEAIKQIRERGYADKWAAAPRPVTLVGINFNPKQRNIDLPIIEAL